MEQRNAIIEREMFERWRQEQNELWQEIAPKVLAEACEGTTSASRAPIAPDAAGAGLPR